MAKMKANPLGHLMMEVVYHASAAISESESEARMRDQLPVTETLAGADTYKVDAKKPSSRAEVEIRRMHIDGGADLKGVNMAKEFPGKNDSPSKEFTADKSA
jgi:ribosomal protein S6E (S10)